MVYLQYLLAFVLIFLQQILLFSDHGFGLFICVFQLGVKHGYLGNCLLLLFFFA